MRLHSDRAPFRTTAKLSSRAKTTPSPEGKDEKSVGECDASYCSVSTSEPPQARKKKKTRVAFMPFTCPCFFDFVCYGDFTVSARASRTTSKKGVATAQPTQRVGWRGSRQVLGRVIIFNNPRQH